MDNLFTSFGLNKKESAAFLELIRLGACPISKWATHTNTNRTSMYVLLDRLKSKGLVTSYTHHEILYVQAVPMTELPALLADKQHEIERSRDLFIKNLAELQKLEKSQGLMPKISYYEGANRVETMYENMMKEKSFKAYFHPGRVKTMMPEYFHKIPQSLKANGGSAQEILIACKEATEYQKLYHSGKHEIKIFPPSVSFSSDTIITNQKIYLVGYSDTYIVGTEIWNEELARTQSVIFDLLWKSVLK